MSVGAFFRCCSFFSSSTAAFFSSACFPSRSTGVMGSLSGRREPLTGTGMRGFECTIAVDDIDQTIRAVEANGGKTAMAKFHIPTVGTGFYFHDTEGNRAGAMQYETPR